MSITNKGAAGCYGLGSGSAKVFKATNGNAIRGHIRRAELRLTSDQIEIPDGNGDAVSLAFFNQKKTLTLQLFISAVDTVANSWNHFNEPVEPGDTLIVDFAQWPEVASVNSTSLPGGGANGSAKWCVTEALKVRSNNEVAEWQVTAICGENDLTATAG